MKAILKIGEWALASLLLVMACEREIYSLSITPEAVDLRSIHDHPVLTATMTDATGEEIVIDDVVWSSSDPHVVEINEAGRVTARGNGQAVITAKTKGDGKQVKVTVNIDSWQ